MRWLLAVAMLSGCATMSLRIGGVMVGGHPAFQASIEVGTAIGGRHSVQLTQEHGVEAAERAAYVGALDVDYVASDPELGPIARVGPRFRASEGSAALEVHSTVFTGLFRDPETRSGGLGLELAGGVDLAANQAVFEAAIVAHGRWPID